jgi:phosphatidylglycerophosphatase A
MDANSETSSEASPAAWTSPAVVLATGFWLGRSPIMPGTVGAVLGLPLAWAISLIPQLAIQIIVIAAICAVGIPICTAAARKLGGLKDPGCIVFDEIASLPITFFLVPLAAHPNRWIVLAVGFVLHRFFDITKVPPADQLERLTEGLGIMADDWAAGIYSCLALHAILWMGWL